MNAVAPCVHADRWEPRWPVEWHEPRRGEPFRRCSWCGSLHPDELVALHAAGQVESVHWADQKYGWPHKFYVDVLNPDPELVFCVGGRSEATVGPWAPGGEHYTPPGPGLVRETELSKEQRAICVRDGMMREGEPLRKNRYVEFGARRVLHGKFYTKHLCDPGLADATREIVALLSGLRVEFVGGKVRWTPYSE